MAGQLTLTLDRESRPSNGRASIEAVTALPVEVSEPVMVAPVWVRRITTAAVLASVTVCTRAWWSSPTARQRRSSGWSAS